MKKAGLQSGSAFFIVLTIKKLLPSTYRIVTVQEMIKIKLIYLCT